MDKTRKVARVNTNIDYGTTPQFAFFFFWLNHLLTILHTSCVCTHFVLYFLFFMPTSPAVESLIDQLDKLYNDCLAIKQDVDRWLEQGTIDGLYRFDQMVTAELKFLNKVNESRYEWYPLRISRF